MNKHDFEQLLRNYTLGNCTGEQKMRVYNWYQNMEVEHDSLLSRKEHDLTEQKILNFIKEKLEENEGYLQNKTSTDGFVNTCLLYAGTLEIFLLI